MSAQRSKGPTAGPHPPNRSCGNPRGSRRTSAVPHCAGPSAPRAPGRRPRCPLVDLADGLAAACALANPHRPLPTGICPSGAMRRLAKVPAHSVTHRPDHTISRWRACTFGQLSTGSSPERVGARHARWTTSPRVGPSRPGRTSYPHPFVSPTGAICVYSSAFVHRMCITGAPKDGSSPQEDRCAGHSATVADGVDPHIRGASCQRRNGTVSCQRYPH
jgi:hypothetical protein